MASLPHSLQEKSSSGFTLVELLVVIGIFSILMVGLVVAVNPTDQLHKASDTVVISDVSALGRGAEAFASSHNGFYPATLEDLKLSDEVRLADNPPEGYPQYVYISSPPDCDTGISCASIEIFGQLKAQKYLMNPLFKFESESGKTCFVNSIVAACP